MLTRSMILAAVLVLPASAEWRREVITAKDSWSDTPRPHSLAYFIRNPFLRDDGSDFCISCTTEEKAALPLKIKFKTEVLRVGTTNGFTVFDVLYRFGEDDAPDWKAVLVQIGPGQYRELFHLQRTTVDDDLRPSLLLQAGREQVLSTEAYSRGVMLGYYFWLGKDGAIRLDTRPFNRAAQSVLRDGKGALGDGQVDFPSLKAKVWVLDKGEYRCCNGGSVEVKFKLERGRIMVTGTHYDPSDRPWPKNERKQE